MAQNLSSILVRQQLQATIASTRPDTITNPKVGATFQPSIGGGLSNPDADVLYAFKVTNEGSAGDNEDGVVTLTFSTGAVSISDAFVDGDASNRTLVDAEGNDVTGLGSTGRIVALLMYTNPDKHTSNIQVKNTQTGDGAEFFLPDFDFVIGGTDVKSLMVVPDLRPFTDSEAALTLQITFGIDPASAGGADELNVVVLGRSA
tara:strand:+ start:187 stop:795 length:609 start_codon:yes stop_codon:yes gene_type:complete